MSTVFAPQPNTYGLLKIFVAVVGTTAEVADKIRARFTGKAQRISPVLYQPDVHLLTALRAELAGPV